MADKEIRVDLKLTGLEEFRSALSEVGDAAGELGSSFSDFGDAIGEAATNIATIVTVAGAAAASLAGLALSNAEAGEKLVNLSKKTGVATEEIERYGFVAQSAGISTEEFSDALVQLSISMAKNKIPAGDLEELQKRQGREQSKLNKLIDQAAKDHARLVKETQKHVEEQRKQNAQIELFNAQNPKFRKSLIDIDNGQDRIAAATERANARYEAQQERLREINGDIEEFGKSNSKLNRILKSINPTLAEQFNNAKDTGEAFKVLILGMRNLSKEEQNLISATAFRNVNLAQLARLTTKEFDELIKRYQSIGGPSTQKALLAQVALRKQFSVLTEAIHKLSEDFTDIFTPSLTEAGKALEDFIIENRESWIEFAQENIPAVIKAIKDLFNLITKGNAGENPSETAVKINKTFQEIKKTFIESKATLTSLNEEIDKFAKLTGFADSKQLALTLVVLKFTGLLQVASTAIIVFKDLILLAATNIGALRAGITLLFGAITGSLGVLAAVGTAIFFIVDKTIGWDVAIQKLKETWNEFIALAPFLFDELKKVADESFDDIVRFFSGIPEQVTNSLSPETVASFQAMWELVKADARATIDFINGDLGGIPSDETSANIVLGFGEILEKIKDNFISVSSELIIIIPKMFLSIIDGITTAIGTAFALLTAGVKGEADTLEAIWNAMIKRITDSIQTVKRIFNDVIAGAQTIFSGIGSAFSGEGHAQGGMVRGSGTSTSDSIPAWLSDGEFVVRASAVRKYGAGFLHAINNGMFDIKGFAEGGLANLSDAMSGISFNPQFTPTLAGAPSGRPLTLVLPNGRKIPTMGVDESTAKSLEKELRNSANAKIMQLPEWYSGR